MRSEPHEIAFVPVTQDHFGLLLKWLNEPHVREWWGEPEEELGFIREMVEGRDTTRPFLILADGLPVGYIQYWFIGHHQNAEWIEESPWLAELPPETVGVDLSIGEPGLLSRGIGSAALSAFVARLREEGRHAIVIDPDRANGRAVRAYLKAGFRPVRRLEGRTGDTLILQHAPNADETQ